MAASTPRGIRVIDSKNADKSRFIRYRVRVERGGFVGDRYFADLERAKLFLEDIKTPQGRLLIEQGRDRASIMVDEVERLAAEFVKERRCKLSDAVDSYLCAYVNPKLDSEVDKERVTAKAAKARLQFCKTVRIPTSSRALSCPPGRWPASSSSRRATTRSPLATSTLTT